MKYALIMVFSLLFCTLSFGASRDLLRYLPKDSSLVVAADFSQLRGNQVFNSLESSGKIWSTEKESEVAAWLKKLGISPEKDVASFAFSTYVNAYGSGGQLKIFETVRDVPAPSMEAVKYLNHSLYRIDPDEDVYAVLLTPRTLALGDLNEAKSAIDLAGQKLAPVSQNAQMNSLLQKIPAQSPVWGAAIPLSRREAANTKTKQSTNAVLEAFQNYYFYGMPTKDAGTAQFFGQTTDASQAAFVNTFAIGTLTFAKMKAKDEKVADMLDQINVEQKGTTIHVSANVTKEMVDAYLRGELGVK